MRSWGDRSGGIYKTAPEGSGAGDGSVSPQSEAAPAVSMHPKGIFGGAIEVACGGVACVASAGGAIGGGDTSHAAPTGDGSGSNSSVSRLTAERCCLL